jgi:ribosome maturation factor RimP
MLLPCFIVVTLLQFAQGLEAELGAEVADDISLEVSSPGAERTLIIPQDLDRFKVRAHCALSNMLLCLHVQVGAVSKFDSRDNSIK